MRPSNDEMKLTGLARLGGLGLQLEKLAAPVRGLRSRRGTQPWFPGVGRPYSVSKNNGTSRYVLFSRV
jgi:hypothetical protein